MDFQERCDAERKTIMARLKVRYSRRPEKRQERWDEQGGRLPMELADALERRRPALADEEFSRPWNERDGALP